jgi:hypothetical protein
VVAANLLMVLCATMMVLCKCVDYEMIMMILCARANHEGMVIMCAWVESEAAVLCAHVKQVVMAVENVKVKGSSLGSHLVDVL